MKIANIMHSCFREWWRDAVNNTLWLHWIVPAYFGILSFLGDGSLVRAVLAKIIGGVSSGRIMTISPREAFNAMRPRSIGWDLYWFLGGVFLAILYAVLSIKNRSKRKALFESLEKEKQHQIDEKKELSLKLEQVELDRQRLNDIVARYDFFKVNLGLLLRWYMTYIWKDLGLGQGERMTLYRFDAESQCLASVDRHSDNLGYRQIGRDIPIGEDCVLTRAWRNGVVYCGDLPNPETATKRYKKKQKDLGCKLGILDAFKMYPRTYFAWRIADQQNRNPMAVVLVESISENYSDQNALVSGFEKHREFIYMFVHNFGKEIPCLPIAEKAGF